MSRVFSLPPFQRPPWCTVATSRHGSGGSTLAELLARAALAFPRRGPETGGMIGPTSHLYFSQRLRLHYVTWGKEGAPPLLLIHGGRDHCRNWDWVAARLAGRYHLIAPDLRGHGDSEWATGASYNEINYVYDIAQLVHQKADGPVTIIAHSLGGSIGLLYAGLFPETVKKIVAIEGLGPSPQMLERMRKQTVEQRVRGWIEQRREGAGRLPRKYATFEDAVARMKE